jgi:hypothetical protein
MDIVRLDPLRTGPPDNPTWHVPDCVVPIVAVSVGILAIVLWAVLTNY